MVKLKDDVPVKENLENFELKEVNKDKLFNFLREMEFNRLLSQVIGFYGNTKEISIEHKNSLNKKNDFNYKSYEIISNEKQLDDWIENLDKSSVISVDTETSSLNPLEAELVGVSFCFDNNKACYVPIAHVEKKLDKKIIIKKIKKILEDPSIKKVGQNIKYDYRIFLKEGIRINPIEDTMLMSYVLDAGMNRHNLDLLSELHLGHKPISYKDLTGSGKKQLSFAEVDIKKAAEYAAEDADVTFRLYKIFDERLKNEKIKHIYEIFEKPLVKILSQMETNGIKVDDIYLRKLSKKFEQQIGKIEKEIFSIAKKNFNIGSPKQLGEIIYNELKIAKLKKTKKGSLATSANILEDLAFEGHKFPKKF